MSLYPQTGSYALALQPWSAMVIGLPKYRPHHSISRTTEVESDILKRRVKGSQNTGAPISVRNQAVKLSKPVDVECRVPRTLNTCHSIRLHRANLGMQARSMNCRSMLHAMTGSCGTSLAASTGESGLPLVRSRSTSSCSGVSQCFGSPNNTIAAHRSSSL